MDLDDEVARQLTKGRNIGLRELDAELGSLTVVLESGGSNGQAVDADVSVLLLDHTGKVRSDDDIVFYNQPIALGGAVRLRDKIRPENATDDGVVVSADVVTLELDDVPDDVQSIVFAASLDPALGATFGDAAFISMRLQRTADAHDLISFPIEGASTETALLFGEFYRRNSEWRVRAVGQGYDGGLAALISAHGVNVQDDSEPPLDGPSSSEVLEFSAPVVRSAEQRPDIPGVVTEPTRRVSVRRPTRPPRMPADWGATIPANDATDWQRARLFPVAGIGGGEEQERRATSALLAVMSVVREFGRVVASRCGAPAGTIETFIEVPFGHDEDAYRPDGVIRVLRGQRTWQALVEVKTSDGRLKADQVDSYVEIARDKGIDSVITISNELTGAIEDNPVAIDRRKLRKVKLIHLPWDQIRTDALLLAKHGGVADPTQRRVLDEFIRYMAHPRSGLHGFTDMGPRWVAVREAVKAKTLRSGDKNTARGQRSVRSAHPTRCTSTVSPAGSRCSIHSTPQRPRRRHALPTACGLRFTLRNAARSRSCRSDCAQRGPAFGTGRLLHSGRGTPRRPSADPHQLATATASGSARQHPRRSRPLRYTRRVDSATGWRAAQESGKLDTKGRPRYSCLQGGDGSAHRRKARGRSGRADRFGS